MSESKSMREIHEIRARHYEETKSMSSKEYILRIREGANRAKNRIEAIRKSKPRVRSATPH